MPVTQQQLDATFSPRTVAVVGSKKADDYMWLRNMTDFKGTVYSVQLDENEIPGIEELGFTNYKSLSEIPEPVDYVVVAVPRKVAPIVVKDALNKGVKGIHMFTSGFVESGSEEGLQVQQQIEDLLRDSGTVLIGPNCMGVFDPKTGIRFGPGQDVQKAGSVAVISQSGGHASSLTQAIQGSGIGINKSVSFGNALLVDSPDLLRYFADDPQTSVICAYIEGPRNGREFFNALREAASKKPVVLWKGGQTDAGKRSAASHTGSLAGSGELWAAMARQVGAIRADSLEEALDAVKALVYLPPATGDRVGIIGGSGGQSVSMSDDCSRAGLQIPMLTQESLDELTSFFQLVGASFYNPMDVGGQNRSSMEKIISILAHDANIDAVALLVANFGLRRKREDVLAELDLYQKARDASGKPFLAMFWAPIPYDEGDKLKDMDQELQKRGIPVFPSPFRAARALRKLADYYRATLYHGKMEG